MRTALLLLGCLWLVACGDDADPSDAGTAGSSGSGGGGSELGPTARVRVVNLVPDVTFDAWGPNADGDPVLLGTELEFGTISEFLDVPINMFSQEPIFLLWATGDVPEGENGFSSYLDNTHERMRVSVGELDGEGEAATVIITPTDDAPTATLQYQQLDETETDRGDSALANLHITVEWEAVLDTSAVPGIALEGQECLFTGSSSVSQVWSVPPGDITLGYYDIQTVSACEDAEAIATFDLDVAAGDNQLVVFYLDGDALKMISAPLSEP